VSDSTVVEGLLETLPPREREIVRLRFYEELSQSEIAERIGISQMHVSRLLRRSFEQMRRRAQPADDPAT
jgi:RNA polymerase sigma-B factor